MKWFNFKKDKHKEFIRFIRREKLRLAFRSNPIVKNLLVQKKLMEKARKDPIEVLKEQEEEELNTERIRTLGLCLELLMAVQEGNVQKFANLKLKLAHNSFVHKNASKQFKEKLDQTDMINLTGDEIMEALQLMFKL